MEGEVEADQEVKKHALFLERMNDYKTSLLTNEFANKIIDGLDKLYHKYEAGASERWIWELLQNAKDCCAVGQDKVKVEIVLDHQMLEFRHSGKPFSIDDIQTIVHQTSLKERTDVQELEEPDPEGAGEKKADQQEYVKNVVLDSIIDGMAPETTGKFGTGFLTTHLLSRIVQITGIFTALKVDDPVPDD